MEARHYLHSDLHVNMPTPAAHLIMVMGLPGSGKTFFADALAQRMGAAHFNSDRIRKEEEAQPHYADSDRSGVYARMFAQVTGALAQGGTVIVDATFSKAAYRDPYLHWAQEHHIPVHLIVMEASEPIIAERVGRKRPDSDADFAVYLTIKAEQEPITQDHLVLNTDAGTTEQYLAAALEHINTPRT